MPMIKQFLKYLKIEMRLLLREPAVVFFVMIFPTFLLMIFVNSFGANVTVEGRSFVDFMLPSIVMYAMLNSALISFGVTVNRYRKDGLYNMYRNRGITISSYIFAQVVSELILVLISVCFTLFVSKIFFHAELASPSHIAQFISAIMILSIPFYLVGALLGLLLNNPQSVNVVGMICSFIAYFLSGMMVPIYTLNDTLKSISAFLPTTIVISELTYVLNHFYTIYELNESGATYIKPNWIAFVIFTILIVSAFVFVLNKKMNEKR